MRLACPTPEVREELRQALAGVVSALGPEGESTRVAREIEAILAKG